MGTFLLKNMIFARKTNGKLFDGCRETITNFGCGLPLWGSLQTPWAKKSAKSDFSEKIVAASLKSVKHSQISKKCANKVGQDVQKKRSEMKHLRTWDRFLTRPFRKQRPCTTTVCGETYVETGFRRRQRVILSSWRHRASLADPPLLLGLDFAWEPVGRLWEALRRLRGFGETWGGFGETFGSITFWFPFPMTKSKSFQIILLSIFEEF